MFGKIISMTRTFRNAQPITTSQFVEMPKTSLVDGTVVDNTTDARAGWRSANGWKVVVDDSCQCTNDQCPVFSHYCHAGCEHWDSACPYNETCPQDGKIHRRFTATATSSADAMTIARSIESEGVAQMTKQQQSYILEKLAKVVAKTASCIGFIVLSAFCFGEDVKTSALGNLTDTSIVVTNVDLSGYQRVIDDYTDTNAVKSIVNAEVGGTNSLMHVGDKVNWANVTNHADVVTYVEDYEGNKTAVTIGSRNDSYAVGVSSLVVGSDCAASEYYSHAEGFGSTASGAYSHAEGWSTTASGMCSHAEGYGPTASGDYSHAEGYDSNATGNFSHAEGCASTAAGECSHAGGYLSHAVSDYSFVWNGDNNRWTEYISVGGAGTFNINPMNGLSGFYIGEENITTITNNILSSANARSESVGATITSNFVKTATLSADEKTLTLGGYKNGSPFSLDFAGGGSEGGSGDASFVYYGDVQLTTFKMTGESVTYSVHDAIGGDGVKRYAAKFPSIEGVSFKLHSVSNFNPLVEYFTDAYTTKQHFLSKVYSLGNYDVDEDLYEYATYLCKPMSRYVSDPEPEHVFPLSFILVKNMIGGLGARFVSTSVEDSSFTITVNSNEVSISNIHISNATNVFYSWSYYDEYYIQQTGVSEARITIADENKTDMKVYMVGDGSQLVTEDTKYDGTSELVIRTGKAGERGTGYGYKIFKGTTEELYWKVYVRNAGIAHDVSDKSYSLPRGYPYYELRLNQPLAWGPSMVLIDTEVYSTEGTYGNDGCSNVTYYVDLHTGLYSERGYGCSLIVSNVLMTGTSSNVTVLPNTDVMLRSGNTWVNPNFVPMRTGVRFAVGSYYNTYTVTDVKIPCQADGSIVCTVTSANSLKIPITYTCSSRLGSTTHNSYLIVTLSDVPWVKVFFDTRVANVRNNNMAYDSVLKCTWELKVTNGCFYAEIVSGEDYREGGL